MNTTMNLGSLAFLQGGGAGGLIGLLPFILIFVIFYFLLIRPQQRKQRKAQQERTDLLKSLKAGDKVITTGGVIGTITAVRDASFFIKSADKTILEIARSAVAGVDTEEEKK